VVSVTPEIDLLQKPPNISSRNMSLESYQALLSSGGEAGGGGSSRESRDFRAGLKNSIIVSATVTLFGTMISIVSGYTFARYRFVGRQALLVAIILTSRSPLSSSPSRSSGLCRPCSSWTPISDYLCSILSFGVPLTTWVSASYIRTIPREIEEGSLCGRGFAVPGLRFHHTSALSARHGRRCDHLVPECVEPVLPPPHLRSAHAKQLTVVVTEFIGKDFIDRDLLAAAGMIAIIPPALLVIFLNKYIVGGLVQGAVK